MAAFDVAMEKPKAKPTPIPSADPAAAATISGRVLNGSGIGLRLNRGTRLVAYASAVCNV